MNATDKVQFFVCGPTKAPQRKKGDAGVDIFVPSMTPQFMKDLAAVNLGQPFQWGLIGAPPTKEEAEANKGVYIYLPPGKDLLIPTYIKARFPDNIVLQVNNKSGVCTNQKFTFGANIIDSSYTGMIHMHVFNNSSDMSFIEFSQKLVQIVPLYFNDNDIEIFYDEKQEQFKDYKNFISEDKFFEGKDMTQRGDKGFGSTGLKGDPERAPA